MPRIVLAYGEADAQELLRGLVAEFHGVRPDRVVIARACPRCGGTGHGRPVVVPTATIRRPAYVSLARAGTLALAAVTDDGEIGVDVEADGAAEFEGFDAVALHPEEAGADRTRAWVRKEAVLKAYGVGLAADPRSLQLDGSGVVSFAAPGGHPDSVWMRDVAVPGFVAAVAVVRSDAALPDPDLVVRG